MKKIFFFTAVLCLLFSVSLDTFAELSDNQQGRIYNFYYDVQEKKGTDNEKIYLLETVQDKIDEFRNSPEWNSKNNHFKASINELQNINHERLTLLTGEEYVRTVSNGVKLVQNNEKSELFFGDVLIKTYSHNILNIPFIGDQSPFLNSKGPIGYLAHDQRQIAWENEALSFRQKTIREKYNADRFKIKLVTSTNLLYTIETDYESCSAIFYDVINKKKLFEDNTCHYTFNIGTKGVYFAVKDSIQLYTNDGKLIEIFQEISDGRGTSILDYELLENGKIEIDYLESVTGIEKTIIVDIKAILKL